VDITRHRWCHHAGEEVHLDVVLDILTSTPQTWATVINAQRRVVGTVALSDIVQNYQRTARNYLRQLSEKGGATGLVEVVLADDSTYVGVPLRSSSIPRGVLITSIERGRDVIRPNGNTVLRARDRVTALGASQGLKQLARSSTMRGG
jgi:Trk K+ transport system NAD-binding subunit